jgi:hypothetical protein
MNRTETVPVAHVSFEVIQAHAVLLTVSAAVMLAYASFGLLNARPTARIVSAVLGVGYLTYGVYLILFFHYGRVYVSNWAYLPPALIIVNAFRTRRRTKAGQRLEQARANHARDAMPPPPA